MRPEVSGVLTRSRGRFEDILENSDLIVELLGGIDPTREYVLRALGTGRHVVTANKQLLSQHGEEVFDAAREGGVQLRFEGAVAGVVPAIRVMSETLAAAHIERVHGIVNGTTNYILTEMARTGASYAEALADAQELGLRRGRPHRGRDRQGRRRQDGDPRAPCVQRDGAARPGELRGNRAADRRRHRIRQGARALAQADRVGRAHRRRHRRARLPRLPLRGPSARVGQRGLQRGDHRVAGDHRDHPVGPGRGGYADRERRARRRDLGDDPAALPASARGGRDGRDRHGVLVLPAPRGRRPPGSAGPGGGAARAAGRVDQVGGAEGPGRRGAARDGHASRCSSRGSARRSS